MEINDKQINAFLQKLNEAEQVYLNHCSNFSQRLNTVIKQFNISKEEFCAALNLKPKDYEKFISGGWNYNLWHIAAFDALHGRKLHSIKDEEIEKKAKSVKFPEYKHSETPAK